MNGRENISARQLVERLTHDAAFDEIVAAWDEQVSCRTRRCRGRRNPVAWLVIHHGPCFPRHHMNRWRRRMYLDLYIDGYSQHRACGQKVTSIEEFGRIVRL